MTLNFKNTLLLFIVASGFLIFLFNAYKLSLNNNDIESIKTIKQTQIISPLNDKTIISKNEINNLSSEFSESKNKSKYKETTIIVKKGQTFSAILDIFNFKNKIKFEIINSINEIFDLRELNVNQKIIFFENDKNVIKKIIIELDFKTNLVVDLSSEINVVKKELETFSDFVSKEYLITNSLYGDGINNNIPNQILIKLIQLFSFDLDFQRDIRKDTQVSVSYERIFTENKSEYSFGDIQYAQIIIQNNTLEYF